MVPESRRELPRHGICDGGHATGDGQLGAFDEFPPDVAEEFQNRLRLSIRLLLRVAQSFPPEFVAAVLPVHERTEEVVRVLSRVRQRFDEEQGKGLTRANAELRHHRDDLRQVLDEVRFFIAGETHELFQRALDGHVRASLFVGSVVLVGVGVSADVVIVVVVVGGGGGGGGVGGGGGGDLVTGGVDVRVAGFVRGVRFAGGAPKP